VSVVEAISGDSRAADASPDDRRKRDQREDDGKNVFHASTLRDFSGGSRLKMRERG
jgi:hypothetical protein